jgi:hypothetical protein
LLPETDVRLQERRTGGGVSTEAIHRIIEAQVAIRGDDPAIVGPDSDMSYRELNGRANALARHLRSAGLRRCGHGVVTQPPRPDLIVTLLAVLKTGASYSWTRPDNSAGHVAHHEGLSIRSAVGGAEQCRIPLMPPGEECRPQPNLPVLTRGGDIACVLPGSFSPVLIAHSTVLALHPNPSVCPAVWKLEEGGIGIWLTLMSGQPVSGSDLYAAAA